ncbi:TniQ family protein [Rhizobium beringeri]|uniref:TniQ family protein n=1 Tax=Rhizobium ruizarguesonis TaxID=2081791 RepID=UPI00037A7910|nr:TniQ family protein [Rhizobium ruizarguesonis]MCB2400133.1 TniQ family protein [Rhizobium ruizarguesonis]WSG75872.1 TniQ family protein [Rhizobium beringeri]WSH16067.1 TniQ family protein [Rhizobium beringeri]
MSGLFPVPRLNGEPLTSFLSRFARANGARHSRAFCVDMGLDFHDVNRGGDVAIARIAALSGVPVEDLREIAVVATHAGTMFAGAHFPKHTTARSKLRFCPGCVSDDDQNVALMPGTRRFARAYWMLPQVRRCPDHSRLLMEVDEPRLKRHHCDFITQLGLVQDQMENLERASTISPASPFEKFVVDRFQGVRGHGDFLDNVEVSVGMVACELIGIADLYGIQVGPSELSDDQKAAARQAGFESLLAGVSGFTAALDRVRSNELFFNVRGGRSLYGKLYMALNEGYDHPQFDTLRDRMREHTLKSVPILNGSDFFGVVEGGEWTSVAHIAKITGWPDSTLRRVLVRFGYLGSIRQPKGAGFLKAANAAEAIERLTDLVSLEEAAEILGFGPKTVRRFVDDGLLKFVLEGSNRRNHDVRVWTRFSRTEIMSMVGQVVAVAVPEFPTHWVSLHDAAKKSGRRLSQILRMVLDGKLHNVGKLSSETGLAGLRLDMDEVDPVVVKRGNLLTSGEARKRLVIPSSTFAFMVREGHLVADNEHGIGGRYLPRMVSEGELRKFESRYVTLGRLSRETGFGTKWLANRLRANGVEPAFPMDDCRAFIVRLSEISRIKHELDARQVEVFMTEQE